MRHRRRCCCSPKPAAAAAGTAGSPVLPVVVGTAGAVAMPYRGCGGGCCCCCSAGAGAAVAVVAVGVQNRPQIHLASPTLLRPSLCCDNTCQDQDQKDRCSIKTWTTTSYSGEKRNLPLSQLGP